MASEKKKQIRQKQKTVNTQKAVLSVRYLTWFNKITLYNILVHNFLFPPVSQVVLYFALFAAQLSKDTKIKSSCTVMIQELYFCVRYGNSFSYDSRQRPTSYILNIHYMLTKVKHYISISTLWAIPGIGCPCLHEVGDISAPVAVNKILCNRPLFISPSKYEQSTLALQPQPEPPE